MRAPKVPSFFRNVKTDHRRFKLRSPHYNPKDETLEQRKRRIEAEVARERGEEADAGPVQISFDRSRMRRRRKSSLMSTLRTMIILIVLVYLLFKGIQWAEGTDFGNVLKILENG